VFIEEAVYGEEGNAFSEPSLHTARHSAHSFFVVLYVTPVDEYATVPEE